MTTPPLYAAEGALADAYTDLEYARLDLGVARERELT